MNTYTRRRRSPRGQHIIAGKTRGHVNTHVQHGVVPGGTADGADWPFPNKPVSLRRLPDPRTQDSLILDDFEKITISKRPTGPLLPREDNSSGIREAAAVQHPREDSYSLPRAELQMAKAIHAKELMLQEKLRRAEEKMRQRIQRDAADAAAGHSQMNEEERSNRGQAERGKAQTKFSLSEKQRRESGRGRETMLQERRQEDVKQIREKQDQKNDDRVWTIHKERARWKETEIEIAQRAQLQTREIPVYKQEVSRELNDLRWENVKEHSKRKSWGEKDSSSVGETGAKERKQSTTVRCDKGRPRENKSHERSRKEMCGSDDDRDVPQMSHQKTSHRAAAENDGGARRKLCGEPAVSPVTGTHSSRPEQGELTYDGLQRLPCTICNRKFKGDRLETHVRICQKIQQSHRQVFSSYVNRTKGTQTEKYLKTHSRSKTPEVLKKKKYRENKANTRNLHEGRLPAGTSHLKGSK